MVEENGEGEEGGRGDERKRSCICNEAVTNIEIKMCMRMGCGERWDRKLTTHGTAPGVIPNSTLHPS